ncbi:MAG: acyltransferase, partial [Bifidobacteriaceae bacterium]|jgi:peptidoglycan/LPS O-acetylase OafA/YrhL|nr:acyltransferase [Bifidobacteriaceae bacterium]
LGAVAEFWRRRIRRLLPAAFTVIALTGLACWLIGPSMQWHQTARDAVASVLYVQNWNLWRQDTDYSNQGAPPSVFQHFWSLSVEEQFYVVWPLLIMVAALIWTRWARRALAARRPAAGPGSAAPPLTARPAIAVVVAAVWAASFDASCLFTPGDPVAAYFVTPTRVWELALGGLLACGWPEVSRLLGAARPACRLGLTVAGLVAMGVAGWEFSDATLFPGWAALLPTAGAALFIAGGAPVLQGAEPGGGVPAGGSGWLDRFWAFRPVRYVGDMSYSVYLWHWPVVLLAPFAVGRELGPAGKLASVGVTLVLSAASYEWVEKPFQAGRLLRAGRWRAFAFAACGMALIGAPGAALAEVWLPRLAEREVAAVSLDAAPCTGAQALLDAACAGQDPHGDRLLMTPLAAANDPPWDSVEVILRPVDDIQPSVHRYGVQPSQAALEVVLWGNSHAVHWLPALERLAPEMGLGITTYVASHCYPTEPGSEAYRLMRQLRNCQPAAEPELSLILASEPDLVVLSNFSPALPQAEQAAVVESSMWVLGRLVEAGVPVLVIKDNPMPYPVNVPNCLDMHRLDVKACDGPRAAWTPADPWFEAVERLGSPLVSAVDLDGGMCRAETCYAVVGGVVVFLDASHFTASYVKSLAPQLKAAIQQAVR